MEIVTLICVILSCIVGICGFVSGMLNKSKNDGALVEKINQAIDGIADLKDDFKAVTDNLHKSEVQLTAHEEQIRTLFNMIQSYDTTAQALQTILSILQTKLLGGDHHE